MTDTPILDKVRLDRWLWAARFYRTRSAAATAIDGGKVQLNGMRVKRSQVVRPGDRLRVRKPPFEFAIEVRALSEHRGAAVAAQALYEETADSTARREKLREQLRTQQHVAFEGKGRPTKQDRRRLERFKESW
jgi:ribosome-associated heat shock protein Hsp15